MSVEAWASAGERRPGAPFKLKKKKTKLAKRCVLKARGDLRFVNVWVVYFIGKPD